MKLVDSSAWIDFFRGNKVAIKRIDGLLSEGTAAITGAVFAEVVSGATNRQTYTELRDLLRGLRWIESPESPWDEIAEVRFTLARHGIQAHLVDLLIALTATHAGIPLLTRDKDFVRIASVLPALELEVF